jgi:geranylgeranyl diphosphate synthase type I
MGARIGAKYSQPVTSASPWDPAGFRDRVQALLDEFVDDQAERLAPLGDDAARLVAAARAALGAASGSVRCSATRGSAPCAARCRRRPARWSAPRPRSRCCTPRAGARRLHGRLGHAPREAVDAPGVRRDHRGEAWRGDPEQYGAAAAILLGDLLLSWSDELLRTCGLPADDVASRCRSSTRPAAR